MVDQRDLSQEPVFALGSIQSDLLLGHSKDAEALIFFRITHVDPFKHFLRHMPFTSAAAVYRPEGQDEAVATGELPPNPRYGVAFTHTGLKQLTVKGVDAIDPNEVFVQGLAKRALAELNDPDPSGWLVGKPDQDLHGVFIITGAHAPDVEIGVHRHFTDRIHGFEILTTLRGNVRPGAQKGHEHFGFLDGVSQPGIRGCVDPGQTTPLTPTHEGAEASQGLPGQDLLWPGEFVFGYPEQNPDAPNFEVKGPIKQPPLPFMVNGAYLVIRRLKQLVPEMHAGAKAGALSKSIQPELLEAQLVGRWPSGAPLLLSPTGDDPALGGDEARNNNFEFGIDRGARVCPWAAHIRKAYPRDEVAFSDDPDPTEDLVAKREAGTQTHRMLRRGIQFGPELTDAEKSANRTLEERGLLFKCYVTDLANQFEFVQKQWVNNLNFSQPRTDNHAASGIDAIIGQAPGGDDRPFLGAGDPIPGTPNQKPMFTFKPWVVMTGGGYFFAPSLDFLRSVR